MRLFVTLFRRSDAVQRTLWFRIVASVLVLIVCGGFFGVLLQTSYSLDAQRAPLIEALSNQNFKRGDANAISLRERGTVMAGGHQYGGPDYLKPRMPLFDDDGNIINIGPLVEALLVDQRPDWAPDWLLNEPDTTWILAIACTSWLLLIVWMSLFVQFALTVLGTAVPVAVCYLLGHPQLMLAFAGIGILTFTFLLLVRLVLMLLNRPNQITAVAHTVVKEGSRRGIGLVFIVLLLVILPLIPVMLDSSSPLRFQIQTFISTSLGLTFAIAAVMTLFFSCASVAFEIRDRQIWQLMTKPLARFNYLIGKWLGVIAINAVILAIAGISTFTFIHYLRNQPVERSERGQLDLLAVRDEVLTARLSQKPAYEKLSASELRTRVDELIENDPNLSQRDHVPAPIRQEYEKNLQTAYTAGQRSVPPEGSRSYTFTGLSAAKKLGGTISLRYKFYTLTDDEHKVFNAMFVFNENPNLRRASRYVPSISHSMPLPASLIKDDGTLKVDVYNLSPKISGNSYGALNFEEDGLELLYKAGTFEGNFFRAMLTIWIKLAFLAALGIGCATFLSFPVACLLSFTVFFAGILGPFLNESLQWYYPVDSSRLDWGNIGMVLQWLFESITRYIALGVVFLLSSFGEYRPKQDLVEGKLIDWGVVLIGFLKLVVLWSGLSLGLAYGVLRRRQLAIYSGNG